MVSRLSNRPINLRSVQWFDHVGPVTWSAWVHVSHALCPFGVVDLNLSESLVMWGASSQCIQYPHSPRPTRSIPTHVGRTLHPVEAEILPVSLAWQSDLVFPKTEFLRAHRRHGGLHQGAMAHHRHLLCRELLQRDVCLHAGKKHSCVSRMLNHLLFFHWC